MTTGAPHSSTSVDQIRENLRDLLKVMKVVWMYPPDNPLPFSMKQSYAEKLCDLITDIGAITLEIERDKIHWKSETVFVDRSKEESLAGLFFDAGITKLTFDRTLNWDAVKDLLECIRRYQNRETNSGDLTGLLWEANLTGVKFETVEDVSLAQYSGKLAVQEFLADDDDDALNDTGKENLYESLFVGVDYDLNDGDRDDSTGFTINTLKDTSGIEIVDSANAQNIFFGEESDEEKSETATATRAMGYDDLQSAPLPRVDTRRLLMNETQLSEEENEQLRRMLEEDASFDMFESTHELLKELLHQENELSAFSETVTICEKLLTSFIGQGRFAQATDLLSYFRVLEAQLRLEKPQWSERLKEAVITAGSRERLNTLADALNSHSHITAEVLITYLSNFGWEALGSIADLLPRLEHRAHRRALIEYLSERGKENLGFVTRGLTDKRWNVVRNSVTILARIGTPEALKHLAKVVTHPDERVRLELVSQLSDSKADEALELLNSAAYDSDQQIRRQVISSIVARRGASAFNTISDIINDERFEKLEGDDQQALLNAYSLLGGDHALDYLNGLITRANPLRDATLSFFREAAFEALTYNRSDRAEKLLIKLGSSWRPDLKKRAREAIKIRRDRIHGEHHHV
ncbi:HEAT repeat domain-containing protein [bacterium]|nr:HEAT repeat domain-containing protein [bacterium]